MKNSLSTLKASPLKGAASTGRQGGAVRKFQERITVGEILSSSHSQEIEAILNKMDASTCALIYADMDHFRALNSVIGYTGGDSLIEHVQLLISEGFEGNVGVFRMGSGYFVVTPETNREIVEHQCFMINKKLASSIRNTESDIRIVCTISFGVSWHKRDEDPAIALAAAEDTCRKAKKIGSGNINFTSDRVHGHNELADHMMVLSNVKDAMDDGRLNLYAQPIMPIRDDRDPLRYEILLRMTNSDNQIIAPGVFLNIAEEYGMITEIDRWVVNTVISKLESMPELMDRSASFAINLSGKTLNDPMFLSFIVNALESTDYAHKLCFEITETALVEEIENTKLFIEEVAHYGCSVSLDDFGSGLCSFGYLKNIPVDYVKIDGKFIRNINNDPTDLAMVKAITDIGHVLGKKVVAEFVTDATIINMLRAIGVDYAQGYHIGKPIPLEEIKGVSQFKPSVSAGR